MVLTEIYSAQFEFQDFKGDLKAKERPSANNTFS
jgi:hypothetical protein